MGSLQGPGGSESISHKVAGVRAASEAAGADGMTLRRWSEFGGQLRGKDLEALKRMCGQHGTHPISHEGPESRWCGESP